MEETPPTHLFTAPLPFPTFLTHMFYTASRNETMSEKVPKLNAAFDNTHISIVKRIQAILL